MILVAEAGVTSTQWWLLTYSGQRSLVLSDGIHPTTQTENQIRSSIQQMYSQVGRYLWMGAIRSVFFYGAGCTDQGKMIINDVLCEIFPNSSIEVHSDLLGAARALYGDREGVACILGTGSQSCLYFGGEIVCQISSLGYILGDEGSACDIGKSLLNAVFKRLLPDFLCTRFQERYGLTEDQVMENVYCQLGVDKFLVGFVDFCVENIAESSIHNLVAMCLDSFLVRNVLPYFEHRDRASLSIGFSGSVAFHFSDVLHRVCTQHHLSVCQIIHDPIENLCRYHQKDVVPTL